VLLILYGFWCLLLLLAGLWFVCVLGRRGLEQVIVAASLLEQLPEVMLAVQDPIKGGVGGIRQEAATMSTLGAGLVVGLALQGHLLQWVHSLLAGSTLVLGSTEHRAKLVWDLRLLIICLSTCGEIFVEAACFLEKLLKMSLAKKNSIHGGVVAHRKSAFAMTTFEAILVVGNAIRSKEVNEVNGLVTSLALVLCTIECHLDILGGET